MKTKFRFLHLIIIILFISCFFVVYSFINPLFDGVVRYVALYVASSCLTYLYMNRIGYKNQKRLEWLENRLKLWNSISYRVKKAGETSFNELPIGIVIYDQNRVIEWANNYAKEIFLSPLVERKIELISPDLNTKIKLLTNFDIMIYGRTYNCRVLPQDNIIYFIDKTESKEVEKKYNSRMLTLGIISLDNLYQAMDSLDAQERAMQISNIIGILSEWAEKHNIYLRGYSEEQYLMIMDYSQLEGMVEENFKILEDIKTYCIKEGLRITASIGIACEDIPSPQLLEIAEQQLELAINRGGNQCAVSIKGEITYFGARTTSIETRSPVYVRVKAETLSDLITGSAKVYIMSHKDMDADSFGSCLAACKLAKSLKREAKIIFDEDSIDETISNIYKVIQQEHVNILDYFIRPKEALDKFTDDTLLIIVDTQYQHLLTSEKILKKAKRIAIIDHHRRNNEAIKNYSFLYTQSSASSTVELIVEMLQFLDTEVEISAIEATWMLMGVIVDTNNLMYRVSYRTFNILSMLQKYGAEMPKVQRFLRENFDEYVKRMTILNNLEIIDNNYGIAICSDDIYPRAFLAKIADNIISVNNIKAAFCIGRIDEDEIGISARSLDEVNVQVLMEQFGGGGHFNNAAAQIKETTIEDIRLQLIDRLKKIDEGRLSTMKIILTKDVKGKGKEGDIIDIPAGHANFLIRSNQAILATVDNIKQLENRKTEEKAAEERNRNEMIELKALIEKSPISIGVRVGKEGKLFGSVSSKQIVEEFRLQYGINLDKRRMLYEKDIDALGTYDIPIQLHKEVIAHITLNVVEKV
ncbi:MAG: 50S ribosomal protein L9 [Acholeplasmataceae bacterium]|nr:50S ribosomal protein L9 [Acholeplasmataceae bacterium]